MLDACASNASFTARSCVSSLRTCGVWWWWWDAKWGEVGVYAAG